MWRCLLLAAACLVATGCSDQSARPENAIDVWEAVFRYRLRDQPADARVYLEVDGRDPSKDLLSRLRRDWPNLKPASGESKEKGFRMYGEGLKWIDRDTAEVKAGYWFPTKFAGEGYFGDHRVVRDGGRWKVAKVTNETSS